MLISLPIFPDLSPPSLWDYGDKSLECHSFHERQSMPHGSVLTLVGRSEPPQAETLEPEPCVL